MLRFEGVSRAWGGFALSDIDLEVGRGEYFVILGPTGAGKTLLLEVVAGFARPDKGEILFGGSSLSLIPPHRRGFGLVYQDYLLFPNMTVFQNIGYGLRHGSAKRGADMDGTVRRVASSLGVSHLLDRSPDTLSGGEKQRVAIARALVTEPDVLLLDEPLSAVDVNTREDIRAELKRVHREFGTTVIHVTHDRTDAMVLADRMAVMNKGRIVQVGTPRQVFLEPSLEFVARFVGVENIFRGVAEPEGGMTRFVSDGISFLSSRDRKGPCSASIRPEDIILSREATRSSARNVLSGIVKERIDTGPVVRITVDCGRDVVVFATREACSDLSVESGEEMNLVFKASAVNLF